MNLFGSWRAWVLPSSARRPGRTRREALSVTGVESVGPYVLLRVGRGGLEPGVPGQFFMVEALRRLAAASDVCSAWRRPGESPSCSTRSGRGRRALCSTPGPGPPACLGPSATATVLDVERPLLVGGGIGIAPLPYLSESLDYPPAVLGFRSDWHAEAATLVQNAEVVVEPALVTELLRPGHDILACGPEPMLAAFAALDPGAQLAWEAPMACGYGGCYGCAVEIDGN